MRKLVCVFLCVLVVGLFLLSAVPAAKAEGGAEKAGKAFETVVIRPPGEVMLGVAWFVGIPVALFYRSGELAYYGAKGEKAPDFQWMTPSLEKMER